MADAAVAGGAGGAGGSNGGGGDDPNRGPPHWIPPSDSPDSRRRARNKLRNRRRRRRRHGNNGPDSDAGGDDEPSSTTLAEVTANMEAFNRGFQGQIDDLGRRVGNIERRVGNVERRQDKASATVHVMQGNQQMMIDHLIHNNDALDNTNHVAASNEVRSRTNFRLIVAMGVLLVAGVLAFIMRFMD